MKTRKTLGHGNAGSRVALPIFDSIMKAVWADYAPQMALPGPSPEANRRLVALPIDVRSGQRIDTRDRTAFVEYFRLDDSGRLDETQYRLVSRGHEHSGENDQPTYQQSNPFFFAPWFSRNFEGSPQPAYRQREYEGGGGFRQREYEGGGRRPVQRGQRGFDEDERRPQQQPFGFFGGRGGF